MTTTAALAIDIGGTKISCAVVEGAGTIRDRVMRPTPRIGEDVVKAVIELVNSARLPNQVVAVGVGSAGVIDPQSGVVIGATSTLADWQGVRLRDELENAFGLPTTIINDVQAHAWGEIRYGAAKNCDSAFVVAVGTGLGGVLVTRRGFEPGVHGASGHFGHVACPEAGDEMCLCGKRGHLESVASGGAIPALYRRLGGSPDVVSAEEVFRLEFCDPKAEEAVRIAARALGRAIGGAVNLLDPAVVVLAGGMRDPGGAWLRELDAALRYAAIPIAEQVSLVVADLGADAALIGAADYALKRNGTGDA